jgi:two-component system, sensor histidine kinase and response regulator
MVRVLVIEDNDDVRQTVADILGFEGFEVVQAENGRVALDCVKAQVPDLVICDLMMPEVDGWETLKAIRAIPDAATTPFLFLTARADRQDMRRGMELGADDYVTKPFTLDELLGAVRAALAKRDLHERRSEAKLETLRTQLATVLPHEMHTPLACILGYAQVLADPAEDRRPEDVADIAQRIVDAGLRLSRIAENSLLHMQLELFRQGLGDPQALIGVQPTALHDLTTRVARARASSYRRESDLVLELADATTAASERYVAKVAFEVIDNAFKFSAPGTPVRVETRASGERVVFRVSDEGAGMTSAQAAAAGNAVQPEQEGIGLGLSIVRRITSLWGGELSLDSSLDRGTTVTVSLPSRGASIPARPQVSQSAPRTAT